ncbi:MAG: hypothetical protein JW841_03235 [Deltaproteobacteria bacterium]|nr:hypothetical protein [Deltaproteobacteria bacterium]
MDLDFTFLIQLGLFLIVLIVLNPILFKPLLRVFALRHERMYAIKDEIEKLKNEAAADLEVYQARMRAARDAAMSESDKLISAAREEERRLLSEIRQEIAHSLNQAREQISALEQENQQKLQKETNKLASILSTKLLQREVKS